MAEYIDRDTAIRTAREMCVKVVGHGITQIDAVEIANAFEDIPTADVVPKSEVDEIVRQWKEEANCWQNNYITELRANEQIKAEVEREIFEELAREVYSKIPDKILPVTFGEMSRHLDYSDGLNFGSRNAYFDTLKIIAELKKKYTE